MGVSLEKKGGDVRLSLSREKGFGLLTILFRDHPYLHFRTKFGNV